jgi:hypothetical protein
MDKVNSGTTVAFLHNACGVGDAVHDQGVHNEAVIPTQVGRRLPFSDPQISIFSEI